MSDTTGPMIGGFTTLPVSGPELEKFEAWMHGAGGVRVAATSEWEVARWKFGKATLILYRNSKEVRKWTCNDFGVLNRMEKAARAEWRAEKAGQAPVAPAKPAQPPKPTPRQRVRGTPCNGMDIIEPVGHHAEPVKVQPERVHGVTKFIGGNHADRVELKRLLCDRQEWRCFYCGVDMALRKTDVSELATFEHVVPKVSGGPDIAANLVIACSPCNGAVGAMSVYEKMLFRDTLYDKRMAAQTVKGIPF